MLYYIKSHTTFGKQEPVPQKTPTKIFFQQPEYLQGAPQSTYKSNYDISKIPDEVFEKP